jgi:predicted nucleic acid-binding protein
MADVAVLPLLYLDTNVFIIGLEGQAEAAAPVKQLITALRDRPGAAVTSELTLAELLAQADSGGSFDRRQGDMYLDLLEDGGFVDLRPVSRRISIETADLRRPTRQKLPDAIHVVTARNAGCRWFMSADKDARRLPSDLAWLLPDGEGVHEVLDALHG